MKNDPFLSCHTRKKNAKSKTVTTVTNELKKPHLNKLDFEGHP